MVRSPEDYKHSSYRTYTSDIKDQLITKDKIGSMVARDEKKAPQQKDYFVKEQ
jgi:hypothetical protein